jgi:starch-binding outer membrane protein, SusD/RagB family
MMTRRWKELAVAAALLSMAAAGCTDPTVAPKSTVTQANIFTDPGAYQQFLARIYAGLIVTGQQGPSGNPDIAGIDEGFGEYLRLYWYLQEMPTDEAVIGWNDPGLPDLNTGLWGADNSMINAMYYRVFYQVMLVNEFLRQSVDDSLDARDQSDLKGEVHQYRAEARFMRALSYWHGIDLFANIPLVTDADPLTATPPMPATRDSIFSFIVNELLAVRDELPAAGPSTYGRATPGAANMLLAELYLNAGVYTGTEAWAGALNAAEAVITSGAYSLDPNYRRIFGADNHTSPEMIFAAPQDGGRTQTWGGMTFLVHAGCGGSMSSATYGIDYCWGGYRLKQQAYRLFGAGDGRAAYFWTDGQTDSVISIGSFSHGIAAPKFTNLVSTGGRGQQLGMVDTDFPVFRLSEAHLIYAEAVLRNGGGSRAQALAYVNDLRERAYGDASGNITDAELTLDFILDERGRELLYETRRRADLIRFGVFTGAGYLWAWKGGTVGGTALDAFRDLYPLPANELIANPNLNQNPGY